MVSTSLLFIMELARSPANFDVSELVTVAHPPTSNKPATPNKLANRPPTPRNDGKEARKEEYWKEYRIKLIICYRVALPRMRHCSPSQPTG